MATATESSTKDKGTDSPESGATFVSQVEAEMSARVDALNTELNPKLEELRELQSALDALRNRNGDVAMEEESPTPTPRPRQRRSRKGGTRADEFVSIVAANPGITISEIARKMKLNKPNYLYRVAPLMVEEKRVKREGNGYVAVK